MPIHRPLKEQADGQDFNSAASPTFWFRCLRWMDSLEAPALLRDGFTQSSAATFSHFFCFCLCLFSLAFLFQGPGERCDCCGRTDCARGLQFVSMRTLHEWRVFCLLVCPRVSTSRSVHTCSLAAWYFHQKQVRIPLLLELGR